MYLVVPEHLMLHIRFQGHQLFGSEEEAFLRFLPYTGMAAILVIWPGPFEQTFVPLSQGGSIWNLASVGPVVSEKKMFENADTHTNTHKHMGGWVGLIVLGSFQCRGILPLWHMVGQGPAVFAVLMGNWLARHDLSCWLGRKTPTQTNKTYIHIYIYIHTDERGLPIL